MIQMYVWRNQCSITSSVVWHLITYHSKIAPQLVYTPHQSALAHLRPANTHQMQSMRLPKQSLKVCKCKQRQLHPHLQKQLKTMRLFSKPRGTRDGFRLSREAFYFKFVRRHQSESSTNVLLPLGHFEEILQDEEFRTARGNIRVGYKALDGRYMRQKAFIDLLQAGYIGSDASTTEHLHALIDAVLSGDDSLIVAVQRLTHQHEKESDHQRLMHEWEVDSELG